MDAKDSLLLARGRDQRKRLAPIGCSRRAKTHHLMFAIRQDLKVKKKLDSKDGVVLGVCEYVRLYPHIWMM
tara:strand:- start:1580 stop:1792 length:213 start_codon:yes stop_codon:yes gene_type:complete